MIYHKCRVTSVPDRGGIVCSRRLVDCEDESFFDRSFTIHESARRYSKSDDDVKLRLLEARGEVATASKAPRVQGDGRKVEGERVHWGWAS